MNKQTNKNKCVDSRHVPNQPSDDETSFAFQTSQMHCFIPSYVDSDGHVVPGL